MPPATATATAAARRSPASARRAAVTVPGPRRISGPARTRKASTTPQPLAFRLVEAVHALSEHRLVDRLVRGRAWIAIVGVGLIGIVFMQVSMLRMNTGIGQAVERASTLERENAAMQANISQLSSSERIRNAAVRAGMIPATDATANFLDASKLSMTKAVNGITAPDATPELATTTPPSRLANAVAETAQQTPSATGVTPTSSATGTSTTAGTTTSGTTTSGTTTAGTTTAGTTTQTPIPQPNPTASVAGGAAATGP
jgi:cell division protein FtsL